MFDTPALQFSSGDSTAFKHPWLDNTRFSLNGVSSVRAYEALNTVPDRCRIEIDRRLIPGEDPWAAPGQLAEFLIEQLGLDVPFESEEIMLNCPALGPAGSEELVARLGEAIDAVTGSHRVHAVPFGTDASTLAAAGVPSVVFGPGDIAQAHTCDEWVALDELEQAAEILYRLAVNPWT